jgi:hypothetical protein
VLAIMEEGDWRGIARIIGRGEEVLYYFANQTQYSLEHLKVDRMGFEQLILFQ